MSPKPATRPLRVPAFDTLPLSTCCSLRFVAEVGNFIHAFRALERTPMLIPHGRWRGPMKPIRIKNDPRPARFVLWHDMLFVSERADSHPVQVKVNLKSAENLIANKTLPVAGLVDLAPLLRWVQVAGRKGASSTIRLTYNASAADAGVLIEEGAANLELDANWPDWHLTEVDHIPISPLGSGRLAQNTSEHLRKGLALTAHVVKSGGSRRFKQKPEQSCLQGTVHVANATVLARGEDNSLALFSHPSLTGITMEVATSRSRDCLTRVLRQMMPAATLFDGADFQFLTDEITTLGWTRPRNPPASVRIAAVRDASAPSRALFHKDQLLRNMWGFAVVAFANRLTGVLVTKSCRARSDLETRPGRPYHLSPGGTRATGRTSTMTGVASKFGCSGTKPSALSQAACARSLAGVSGKARSSQQALRPPLERQAVLSRAWSTWSISCARSIRFPATASR